MKSRFILLSIITLLFVSCANKSTVTSYSSLAGYKYAVIDDSKDRGGDASLMNFKIQVQQALQESDLEEVKQKDIEKMSETQKKQLMILQLSGSQSHDNSVATINVIDYTTEKLYLFNGVRYRELIPTRKQGNIYYQVFDIEDKKTWLAHKVLFG